MRIALATCDRLPRLTEDDQLLQGELRRRGAHAEAAVWDDRALDWSSFDRVVIRSCWDYHLRLPDFLGWVDSLEQRGVALWNPASLVRSNVHKSYLGQLASEGFPLVPTVWLSPGSRVQLSQVLDERDWAAAVVKPAVSASAFRTWRISREEAARPEARRAFEDLRAAGDVLVQRFVPEVVWPGEWSFVFVAQEYSHSVLKRPAAGDFRVQDEFGGLIGDEIPSASLVSEARRIAAWIPRPWLYARIDGVEIAGKLSVMEVELIEPSLFLGSDRAASGRLADAILSFNPRPDAPSCASGQDRAPVGEEDVGRHRESETRSERPPSAPPQGRRSCPSPSAASEGRAKPPRPPSRSR